VVKYKNMGDKVECPKCKWNWEIESDDDRPYLCHKCGYDSELGDFDEVALKQWKDKNYYSVNESNKKGMKDLIRKILKEENGKPYVNPHMDVQEYKEREYPHIHSWDETIDYNDMLMFAKDYAKYVATQAVQEFSDTHMPQEAIDEFLIRFKI
jgi:hypothetical protein